MNSSRLVHILMLLLVVLWGTGLARALHEAIDHSHDEVSVKASAIVSAPAHGAGAVPIAPHFQPASPTDDHDDCITCHILALTVATIAVVIIVVLLGALVATALRSIADAVRHRLPIPSISNRGPPVLVRIAP
jgi:hypothetical protein